MICFGHKNLFQCPKIESICRNIFSKFYNQLKELQELSYGNTFEVTENMILKASLDHLSATVAYYGPQGVHIFRKHLPFYIKGKPCASALRQKLVLAQTQQELEEGLRSFFMSE